MGDMSPGQVKAELGNLLGLDLCAVDLHRHTNRSYDTFMEDPHVLGRSARMSPEAVLEQSLDVGFDFVPETDHNTMAAHKKLRTREGLIPAVENTARIGCNGASTVFDEVHSCTYMLDFHQYEEIRRILDVGNITSMKKLEEYIRFCEKEDLPCTVNHLGWKAKDAREPDPRRTYEIAQLFDVLEMNLHRVRLNNMNVMMLAVALGKAVIATSDLHCPVFGIAYTLAPFDDADKPSKKAGRKTRKPSNGDFLSFFRNIPKGKFILVVKHLTQNYLAGEVAEHYIGPTLSPGYSQPGMTRYTSIKPIDAGMNFLLNGSLKYKLPGLTNFLKSKLQDEEFLKQWIRLLYLKWENRRALKLHTGLNQLLAREKALAFGVHFQEKRSIGHREQLPMRLLARRQ